MNTFTASNGYKVTPNGDGANVYRGFHGRWHEHLHPGPAGPRHSADCVYPSKA